MKALRIVIFAKAPLPGYAKSRLIPALGAEGAANLAKKLLLHTVNTAIRSKVGTVELCVTPSATSTCWESLTIPSTVIWSNQGDGNLGARMSRVSQRITGAGESLLIVGTDCPDLGESELQQAARGLKEKNAVIIPTSDGGYALIGFNQFHPQIFADIAWSTHTVARDTRKHFEALNWSVQSFPILNDIDVPSDLKWLPQGWPEKSIGDT